MLFSNRISTGVKSLKMELLFKHVFVKRYAQSWIAKSILPGYCLGMLILYLGLSQGLWHVPSDVTQGEVYRIIYIHVPLSILSLALYVALSLCVILERGLHIKMANHYALAFAVVGAFSTVLAIVTGSIWAKPTWGAWWVWDARLTSEVILLLLYLGYLAVRLTIKPNHVAKQIASYIALIGLMDLPLIHYSVHWWYTLHQGSTILHFAKPRMPWEMLSPLLVCIVGFGFIVASLVCHTVHVVLKLGKIDGVD